MANKRMFSQTIIDSDAFIDMPSTTQLLYFHLAMRADDDGFINNPKRIQRMIGCGEDDLKLLIVKNFVIGFESGVVVIKHWKIHNYIQNDRYKETAYLKEKSQLCTKENKSYKLMDTECIQDVRLDKIRLDKISIDKNIYGEFKNVKLSEEEFNKLKTKFPKDHIKKIEELSVYMASQGKTYKNHYATILNWARKDEPKKTNEPEWLNQKQTKEVVNTDTHKELEEILKKY